MTRRDAAKLAGGVAAAAPFVLEGAPGTDPLVFGLIGAGSYGQFLLERLNRIASGRCAAVCDVDEASLRKARQIASHRPQASRDYRELLDRKDLEAVLIATPLYTHFPILRDALAAGKHVFCENPPVFKPEEIRALRTLAGSSSGRIVQVGLQRRYSQFYQTAQRMAAKGLLGEVSDVCAQWHRPAAWTLRPGPRERNWRLYREFSGGAVAELASHQIDVAGWVFGDSPEFVVGVAGMDTRGDGRDVHDNVALIFRYPGGRKLVCSSLAYNHHLPFFGGARREAGEMIVGTEGTIEITLGAGEEPALGLWFYEPAPARVSKASAAEEIARVAGASLASPGRNPRGLPILLARDQFSGDESFLERELKYSRRWLYSKGIMVPREDRNAVDAQLESFFESCKSGKRPKAALETGLESAAAVILANRAVDEGRRVEFSELDKPARG